MKKIEQLTRVLAVYKPKKTDDLKINVEELIWKEWYFEAMWIIQEEDWWNYIGQWTFNPVRSTTYFMYWIESDIETFDNFTYWIPEEDLEIKEIL